MTPQEAENRALGYAEGREDASGTRTISPTDAPGVLEFAEAYRRRQVAFNAEMTYWMPAASSAYDQWQAARGRPDWAAPTGNLPGWIASQLTRRTNLTSDRSESPG